MVDKDLAGTNKEVEASIALVRCLNPKLSKTSNIELKQYIDLIGDASPSVVKQPLVLANYLEYLVDHKGQLNFSAYTNLVNLEGAVLTNNKIRLEIKVLERELSSRHED